MNILTKIISIAILLIGLVNCSDNSSKIIKTEEYEENGVTCIWAKCKDNTEFVFAVLEEDSHGVEVREVDLLEKMEALEHSNSKKYGDPSARNVVIPQYFTSNKVKYEVKRIGDCAFQGSGITAISMPNGVTEIGNAAFKNCTELTSVTIPKSVIKIGEFAFFGCSNLTSITIPNSVTSISYKAFGNCTDLEEISLSQSLTNIADYLFAGCKKLKSVSIPQGVTNIGEDAFSECVELTSVTIPQGVTEIGRSAFYECSNLTSITIPNSVTSIGDYSFAYCNSLASVIIPNSVRNIGKDSFEAVPNIICETATEDDTWGAKSVNGFVDGFFIYNDKSKNILKSYIPNKDSIVTIPDNVKIIGDKAFSNCEKLAIVNIPSSVTNIGNGAFAWCEKLSSIVFQGSGLTSIGDEAFKGCIELTTLKMPNSVTNIGYAAFEDCKKLHSITIPDGVTRISENLFMDCNSITSISIPNTVTKIEGGAFEDCKNLTSITIPNAVTTIGTRAFALCGMNSVTIPSNVKNIDDYAFLGCPNLTSVIIQNPNLELRYNMFAHCDNLQPQNVVYQTEGSTLPYQGDVSTYSAPSNVTKVYSNARDGFVNIRQTPNINAQIVGELRNGPEGAVLLGSEGEWVKIDCNGIVGYVYEKYVQNTPTEVFEYWGALRKDASSYRFTENDLSPLTAKELTYLRNSVYARHGYVFKSQELNNYFKKFSWYQPNPSVTDAALNSTEKANVEFIRNYQEQNKKTYKPQ